MTDFEQLIGRAIESNLSLAQIDSISASLHLPRNDLYNELALIIARRFISGSNRKLPRLLLMTALALAGLFIVILFLPVSNEVEVQILSVVGIAISALIAVSSTSVIENTISGLVLRINQTFAIGDYIRVEEISGRVTERGLFDTEIQTGERELISLPNSYLLGTPGRSGSR